MTKDIKARKREHLILAQDEALRFPISAGFDRWRFIHNALPEINLNDVSTATEFLGKKLAFPLLISSMSGGVQEAYQLNSTLASAASQVGVALGLGSIRAALDDPVVKDSFLVARRKAPDIVLLANLGIAQVIEGNNMMKTIGFCEELQADGLIIHLNPLQEAFQMGGDTNFSGGLTSIEAWVKNFPLPIIVKEVGQGLSLTVLKSLESIGVKYVDIAGAGGSNWVSIESARLPDEERILKQTAEHFSTWGEPTAEVLEKLETDQFVIASGGLAMPTDLGKALALGAQMGGVAGAILKSAMTGDEEQVIHELRVWQESLKMTLFGTGLAQVSQLIGNRTVLKKMT